MLYYSNKFWDNNSLNRFYLRFYCDPWSRWLKSYLHHIVGGRQWLEMSHFLKTDQCMPKCLPKKFFLTLTEIFSVCNWKIEYCYVWENVFNRHTGKYIQHMQYFTRIYRTTQHSFTPVGLWGSTCCASLPLCQHTLHTTLPLCSIPHPFSPGGRGGGTDCWTARREKWRKHLCLLFQLAPPVATYKKTLKS